MPGDDDMPLVGRKKDSNVEASDRSRKVRSKLMMGSDSSAALGQSWGTQNDEAQLSD